MGILRDILDDMGIIEKTYDEKQADRSESPSERSQDSPAAG